MSLITDFVIMVRDPEYKIDDEDALVAAFQIAIDMADPHGGPQLFDATAAREATDLGPKVMTSRVLVGAGNYFHSEDMLEVIGSQPLFQDHLLVLAQEENDDDWKLVWPPAPWPSCPGCNGWSRR